MNLTDSLKAWLADYIQATDYEYGKQGSFEERRIGNEAWNNANWTAQKGGWGAEIRDSADNLIPTGSWQFKQNNGFWDTSLGVANAITINRTAKRILYYPLKWKEMGFFDKGMAGYESGPYEHKVAIKSIIACPSCKPNSEPSPSPAPSPAPASSPKPAPRPAPAPAPPTYYFPSPPPPEEEKKMECCDMIKDLHKYLGIARLKKDKFKFSKAFMVPGGKGHENCEDYYEIYQSIVRMLANGLILNPISKPLGKGFMSANATSWAADMYEMAAETMSDGNSSQRYEVAAIMQSAQILSILAETARKVEFLADAIGIEPKLVAEEIPCCFTVFEGHKGFDKKQSKKIDITKAKTDDDVEALLAKMYQPSLIPITKWQFSPNSISIIEALRGQ